jgi:cytochrome P450
MNRELAGYLGGAMIEAGADTTSSWMQTLVLAMVAFPEVQKKAQVCPSFYFAILLFDNCW